MAIHELYSKRQARLKGDEPDVYQYADIPRKLKVQIIHIFDRTIGTYEQSLTDFYRVRSGYALLVRTLREEIGVFQLPPASKPTTDPYRELIDYFLAEGNTDACLDVVELAFKFIDQFTRTNAHKDSRNGDKQADEAIADLNVRFKENAVGYQFIAGEIVRVDSELIHAEAVKPALRLLNTKEYAGPHQEFLSAYEHYRAGKNKEALNDCLKAFESTMKAICDKRGWVYKPGDTAKSLIDVLYAEGLIPPFWQNQFASLRGLLESSIPTGRNKQSGHGQGATPTTVPDHMAAYMLHMTASTLVFLTMAEQSLP
jgi:hypothetical protein